MKTGLGRDSRAALTAAFLATAAFTVSVAACGSSSSPVSQNSSSPSPVASPSPSPSPSLAPEPTTADEIVAAVKDAMTDKKYKMYKMDEKGAGSGQAESGEGAPADLNNPNFQLVQTLSPTPDNASTGCEQRVCWLLSSVTNYPNGPTVKVQVWVDRESRSVTRVENRVTVRGPIGFYSIRYEYKTP